MEIAQTLASFGSLKSMNHGIDFIFWDAEDGGTPSHPETYCLGSQYWAKNPIPSDYQAEFGINFDMVGRMGAVFPVERYSFQHAEKWIKKIKTSAAKLGHQELFPDYFVGPVVDDHYFVHKGRGIPMVDLIHLSPEGRFPPEWHTRNDNSSFISRDVLTAVGQTVLQMIFDLEE